MSRKWTETREKKMNSELAELVANVLEEHPGPWSKRHGYTDRGGPYTSIIDAAGEDVYDGEFGGMSESVEAMLLHFPEIGRQALDLLAKQQS